MRWKKYLVPVKARASKDDQKPIGILATPYMFLANTSRYIKFDIGGFYFPRQLCGGLCSVDGRMVARRRYTQRNVTSRFHSGYWRRKKGTRSADLKPLQQLT
jgi:hypothetical protein